MPMRVSGGAGEDAGRGGGLGIALGSGAARGIAHVGVLETLRDMDLQVSFAAGTSMGAVVGALLATGRLAEGRDFFMDTDVKDVLAQTDPAILGRGGLLAGRKLYDMLRDWFGDTRFEDTEIPFACVATSLESGDPVFIDTGELASAIRASVSVPVVLRPWKHGDRWMLDGGIVDPVPVRAVRRLGADPVLAVDLVDSLPSRGDEGDSGVSRLLRKAEELLGDGSESSPESLRDVAETALAIMGRALARARRELDAPDLVIRPELSDFIGTEFHRAEELIARGAEAAGPVVEELISSYGLEGR